MHNKNPRETHRGLLVWKTYKGRLTDLQVLAQIRKFGDEGLEFVAMKNSDTALMFCTNDGLGYAPKRLKMLNCRWKRSPNTYVQLRAEGAKLLLEVADE